jgi:hypothetical protein
VTDLRLLSGQLLEPREVAEDPELGRCLRRGDDDQQREQDQE